LRQRDYWVGVGEGPDPALVLHMRSVTAKRPILPSFTAWQEGLIVSSLFRLKND
jgi:hypothetical protein